MNIFRYLWLEFCVWIFIRKLTRKPKRTWPHRFYRRRPVDPIFHPEDHVNCRCLPIRDLNIPERCDSFVNWSWKRMMEKTEELWPNIQNMPRR